MQMPSSDDASRVIASLDKLFECMERMESRQKEILHRLDTLEQSLLTRPPPPQQVIAPPGLPLPSSAPSAMDVAYVAAVRVAADRKTIEEKATRLVGISIPEGGSKEETAAKDQQLIAELVKELAIPELSRVFESGELTFHRHPLVPSPSLSPSTRASRRPLKVQLPSAELRNTTLDAIRRRRPSCLKQLEGAYWRRDLTVPELALERLAKEEAHKLNSEAGMVVAGVRDTNVYRYSKPRPFTHRK